MNARSNTAFERGFQSFAHVLHAARENKVSGEPFACHRGRGIPHANFVSAAVTSVADDHDALHGLTSAMSGYLAAAADGVLLNPEDFAQATWEDIHGGPNTVYWDEVDPAPPALATVHAPEVWRLQVADIIEQVEGLIAAAAHMDLDYANGPFARQLLHDAQAKLDAHQDLLQHGKPDDYYGDCIIQVQSMVVGARDMQDTCVGFPAVLKAATDLLEKAATILDEAGVRPPEPSGPSTPPPAAPADDADSVEVLPQGDPGPVSAEKADEWRLIFLEDLQKALAALDALEEIGEQGDSCPRVLRFAQRTLRQTIERMQAGALNQDTAITWCDELFYALALLQGAAAICDSSDASDVARRAVLLVIAPKVDAVCNHMFSLEFSADCGRTNRERDTEDHLTDARFDTAVDAGNYLMRMTSYFQAATHSPEIRDWGAMHQAASVVVSALDDEVEGDASLATRLEVAIDSASLIFQEQPPAYWLAGGPLRAQDVGKRVVHAAHAA